MQIYPPFALTAAPLAGRPPPAAALRSLGRPGNWAHELDVAIPPKSATTIELRLTGRLAGSHGHWTLDVDRQSAVHPDDVTVTVDVTGGWRITVGSLNGRGQTANAKLELDRNVQLMTEMTRK